MSDDSDHDITEILAAGDSPDGRAIDRLLPLVYDELRAAASSSASPN